MVVITGFIGNFTWYYGFYVLVFLKVFLASCEVFLMLSFVFRNLYLLSGFSFIKLYRWDLVTPPRGRGPILYSTRDLVLYNFSESFTPP